MLFVCERAMAALGFNDRLPDRFDIKLRDGGYKAEKCPRDSHFSDVGSSFLVSSRANLVIDYWKKTFQMRIQ